MLEGNDVIGDAYEYLIAHFASDAGKKGGEFFTPSAVSTLLSKLVQAQEGDPLLVVLGLCSSRLVKRWVMKISPSTDKRETVKHMHYVR
jgi:hypothetical protein